MLTAAVLTMARRWKQPKCPLTDEWLNKLWSLHGMASYSALKRKQMLTQATTCMNLEDIVLSKRSQSQKDKCYMTLLLDFLGQ